MFKDLKVKATGAAGVGTGAALGEFVSEFGTRAAGLTGNAKLGVKAIVKALVGAIAWFVSERTGGMWSFFAETMAYGSWGSILLDLIARAYPGGVPGLAETAALRLRGVAVTARAVAARMEVAPKVEEVAPEVKAEEAHLIG
ncbi:MAG: hypothetical protein QXT64_02890 [Desulfurococcaceae archaeon]